MRYWFFIYLSFQVYYSYMKIHIATDHAGFELKESIVKFLQEQGYDVSDHGAFEYNESDDYPDFITPCAQAVAGDSESFGIIFGGSGQGEAMCANRVVGVRAGVYYGQSIEIVQLLREHNNANILSLGARFMNTEEVMNAIILFLETSFSGEERHIRRIEKF